ncbi:MAG: hypothetical protein KC492_11630, partial [Myxococcales bacterium]|nr:hypothetical protein [Myxococcales bacterium]
MGGFACSGGCGFARTLVAGKGFAGRFAVNAVLVLGEALGAAETDAAAELLTGASTDAASVETEREVGAPALAGGSAATSGFEKAPSPKASPSPETATAPRAPNHQVFRKVSFVAEAATRGAGSL